MNLEGISNHINHTLNSQKRYIIFNVIVKVSSIFEFIRHEYETTLNEKSHFDKMAIKYSDLARSTELLNNFRNTIKKKIKTKRKGIKSPPYLYIKTLTLNINVYTIQSHCVASQSIRK